MLGSIEEFGIGAAPGGDYDLSETCSQRWEAGIHRAETRNEDGIGRIDDSMNF
jgi:hypothetical protein